MSVRNEQVLEVAQLFGDTVLDVQHLSHRIPRAHGLFRFEHGRYVAHVPESWSGHVEWGSRDLSFAEAAREGRIQREHAGWLVPMVPGLALAAENAGVTWFARRVAEAPALELPDEASDPALWGIGLAAVGLVALFGVLLAALPARAEFTSAQIIERYPVLLGSHVEPREPRRAPPVHRGHLVCWGPRDLDSLPKASTPTLQDPRILGSLDRSAIDAVVQRRLAQIEYCYRRTSPASAGDLTVKFVIGSDGAVTYAGVRGSTVDPAVDRCVEQQVRRLRFPKPPGGGIVIVRYPFRFSL